MAPDPIQTITRLTPLADVLALVEARVKPVTARSLDLAAAEGRILASEAAAPARPAVAVALRDGWALAAADTMGAGPYAPAMLARVPPRIEAGQAIPPGTDSVAPPDAIGVKGDIAEALAQIDPGDGVLPAGGDSDPALPMRHAGERLRAIDSAVLAAAGLARVTVREPRLRVLPLRGSGIVTAAARLIAGDIERCGGAVRVDAGGQSLAAALATDSADAMVALGGTGAGRNDNSVRRLADEGELAIHGMGIAPGETAAFGFSGGRPVLLLPGRLDAALAVWLTVGRRLLARLSAAAPENDWGATLTLSRKVTSTIGLAEVVPVKRSGAEAEPLATKYLPFSALARADGWILVPADSEGYSAGSPVRVWPWP